MAKTKLTEAQKGCKLEAEAYGLLIKAVLPIRNRLQKKLDAEEAKAAALLEKKAGFANIDEVREFWGWGGMSDKEKEALEDLFRAADAPRPPSKNKIAMAILQDLLNAWNSVKRDLEWQLLPLEEQQRIHEQSEEIRRRRDERKGLLP